MNRLQRLLNSSVGAKVMVATTGLLLFGFVIVHLLGNLQIYRGQEAMNSYAKMLHDLGPLLWLARLLLLAIFVVHLGLAIRLHRANRQARPEPYYVQHTAHREPFHQRRVKATRMMVITGVVILLFVLFHLMHFTFGWINPQAYGKHDEAGRHDVFGMVISGFQNPAITLTYVVAMLLLGWHLFHGAVSTLQSLGLTHPVWRPVVEKVLWALLIFVVVGNCFIPLSILLGLWPPGG